MAPSPRYVIPADPATLEVSVHPPHLMDSQDRLPAALIPFCSYQGELLGKEVDGFVACDQFQPTVLEGQICYSLDLTKFGVGKSKAGKMYGFELVLDSNTPGKVARIYLDTLSPFTNYRNGSYSLNSLKKMTGTNGFLAMPDAEKKCQVETLDECNTQKLFEKVRSECHCRFWALDTRREVGSLH